MPSSLKEFIKKQLKENTPLSEIKRDLREKGYALEEINKAVREAIAGIDKKLPAITIVQLSVLVVGVVIAVGVAVYFTSSYNAPVEQFTTQSSSCDAFPEDSCKIAVRIALASYPGEVIQIAKVVEGWKIDIQLLNPILSRDEIEKYNMSVITNAVGDKILQVKI